MAQEFVALPVKEGDAFFLIRGEKQILVDGGDDAVLLPKLINRTISNKKFDIVVCTHNDEDHAAGLIGLLLQWHIPIAEVWLPAVWFWRIGDARKHPDRFKEELRDNIESIASDKEENAESRKMGGYASSTDITEACDGYRHWVCALRQKIRRTGKERVLEKLLKEVERILTIACLARIRGIRIRWFKYSPETHPSGGDPGILEPVNSIEKKPRRKTGVSALKYLFLSRTNIESLVFYSPETEDLNGVLFSADSGLECLDPKYRPQCPTKSFIVTAPHHGSGDQKNMDGCDRIVAWHKNPRDLIWVRSDKHFRLRPFASYRPLAGNKYCTRCTPRSVLGVQCIRLDDSSGPWTTGARRCPNNPRCP
jgi:hypothetical protein